jgi:HK97 gp10 family phage protein
MLKEAPRKIKENINKELGLIGGEMEDLAINIVPVRTGYLKSTIFHRVWAQSLSFGASAPYASYVEFGTRFMSARPFIRPAWSAKEEALYTALVHGVLQAFE